MDKNEFTLVCECNGFEIRETANWDYSFRVFHPSFSGVYIDDFKNLRDAEKFCMSEDIYDWRETLLKI